MIVGTEDVHYERGKSEGYHTLRLNYSVTGLLLEIAVTFSSGVCNKTSVTQYHGKKVVCCVPLSLHSHIVQLKNACQ